MADYRYAVGTFTRRAGAGTQDIPIADGTGAFTPKAVVIWGTVQTSNGFDDTSRFVYGWASGSETVSIATYTPDNAGTTDTRAHMTNLACPEVNTSAPTTTSDSADTFVFSSGNIRLTWNGSGEAAKWHFAAFGGADLTVKAGSINSPAVNGLQVVSVAGIDQITGVLFISPQTVDTSLNSGVAGVAFANIPCVGWADASHQAAIATHVNEFISSAATFKSQRTDLALHMTFGGTFTGDQTKASVTNLGVGGFTLNWERTNYPQQTPFTNPPYPPGAYYLAFAGPQVAAGVIDGTTVSLAFNPGIVLAQTVGGPPTSALQTGLQYSFGAYDGTNHANSWIGVQTSVATSITARRMATDRILTCASPAITGSSTTPTVEASTTFATQEVLFDYQSTDPAGTQLLYFAMESNVPAPGPGPTPTPTVTGGQWGLHRFDMKVRVEERA